MRKNILFISPWYPNMQNPTLGNFIIRQAELIAEDHTVYFIALTPSKTIEGNFRIEEIKGKNYIGIHLYHNSKGFLSPIHYYTTLLRAKEILEKRNAHFDIIHGQIVHRSGYALHFFSSHFKIPVVSSEHWSGYTPERNESLSLFEKLNIWFANKSVVKLLPVTRHLGLSMQAAGLKSDFETWYNVVDSKLFYPDENKNFDFIHLSTLDDNKRPLEILEAFYGVWRKHPEVRMSLGGDGNIKPLLEAQRKFKIPRENLDIHGAISYQEAATRIRKSKCLVQFSRFENLPCTISEAMTSGLFIISSDVGGISEVITDSSLGICLDSNQLVELSKAMSDFISHPQPSKSSSLFNPNRLKEQINSIYVHSEIHN